MRKIQTVGNLDCPSQKQHCQKKVAEESEWSVPEENLRI